MSAAVKCPTCDNDIAPGAAFCAHCGTRLTPIPSVVENKGTVVAPPAPDDRDDLMLSTLRELTVGEYEIRGVLGRGGMAVVFIAYDLALNRKVALKAMHPGLLGDAGMRERFRLEARLAARLDHPNIVSVHAVKERGNIVFFDLKLIDGTSLDRLLRHRHVPVRTELACWLISKIADALNYAHGEGVVHRDMKPGNVMIDLRGNPIVADFGIAKATGETSHLTMTGAVVGTPAYMSPEQCLSADITGASDQYSLGIMAYEMLTGDVPFTGPMLNVQLGHVQQMPPAPRDVVPSIPQGVSDTVMRMLAKQPAQRWPNLALAGEALMEGLGVSDTGMRRELAELIRALPPDARKSLPPTPLSPMPVTVAPAVVTPLPTPLPPTPAPRRPDSATQIVTPLSGPAQQGEKRGFFASSRNVAIFAATTALAAVTAVIAIKGTGNTAAPPPPQSLSDSTAAAAAEAAQAVMSDPRLDAADTLVARVAVTPPIVSLRVGDSIQLAASVTASTGEKVDRAVKWSTSDSLYVRVDQNGMVRGLAVTKISSPVFVSASVGKKTNFSLVTVK